MELFSQHSSTAGDQFWPGCLPLTEDLLQHTNTWDAYDIQTSYILYCMAGNFGGKIFWPIAENVSFGEIYFGG